MPAIRPIGSIAIALKFGMISPKQNSAAASSATKTASGGGPNSRAIARCASDTATKPTSAQCEIRRIPSRSTSRPLTNEATAIAIATPPNTIGNHAPRR